MDINYCTQYGRAPTFACLFLRTRHPPISTLFPYTTLFRSWRRRARRAPCRARRAARRADCRSLFRRNSRSEEHTSELQSLRHLVCRLLLEKKKERDVSMFNGVIGKVNYMPFDIGIVDILAY